MPEQLVKYRWDVMPAGDESMIGSLSKALNGIHPILASILIRRGINTFEKAREFFRPTLDGLHDPFLMKDMDVAVKRIIDAMNKQEKILVYGDYDVDGVTSVSLVYSFLIKRYAHLDYYIPDRYTEGYGISARGIDYAAENGFTLVIALDCGIKANEKVDYATAKGIDFIICDHHRPGEQLPKAVAVLDPKRSDCAYPYKELSGCGVGFKLLQAFSQKTGLPFSELEDSLDFLAISIAADIVPITGENRILAAFGMEKINKNPRQGILSMIELAGLKKELTISDVVFKIAPSINAAGRLQSATSAVEVLLAEQQDAAMLAGKYIKGQNENRKMLDEQITGEALDLIRADEGFEHRKTTVLFNPEWHKGVIGIVASRLIERHYRPTIVLTASNGKITGSARSVAGFDVYEAIEFCAGLLEQYGGHKFAAGLTMLPENLEPFKEKFEAVVNRLIKPSMLTPVIEIDAELPLTAVDPKFFRLLQQFAPFGPGNMNPVFLTTGILAAEQRLLGNQHLKLKLFDPNAPSRIFEAIAFGLGHYYEHIGEGIPFDIVYSLELNEWNGKSSMQLNIKDINV